MFKTKNNCENFTYKIFESSFNVSNSVYIVRINGQLGIPSESQCSSNEIMLRKSYYGNLILFNIYLLVKSINLYEILLWKFPENSICLRAYTFVPYKSEIVSIKVRKVDSFYIDM